MSYHDVPNTAVIKCKRCGAEFDSYYYDFGYISHENKVNDWNLTISMEENTFNKDIKKYNEVDKRCANIWREKYEKTKKIR